MAPNVMAIWRHRPPPSRLHSRGSNPPPDSPSSTTPPTASSTSTLDELQEDIAEALSSLEMQFSPTYFDISVHLLIHLVDQIKALGPMYLHQMFPFERLMKVFRRYVRNRFKPEGVMVEGWSTEEAIKFCTYYMDDINEVGVPNSHHQGRLGGKGTLGRKIYTVKDGVSWTHAQFAVLQQAKEVMPYIEEHWQELLNQYPLRL